MSFLQALTFTTPWALAALALLPVIWWLLRFTPPRPRTQAFPPVRLLMELINVRQTPDKTPWWLLLLRLMVAGLVILGVSHPFYNPGQASGLVSAPRLLVVDNGWASAADWPQRRQIMADAIEEAGNENQPVSLAFTAPDLRPADVKPMAASEAARIVAAINPKALPTDRAGLLKRLKAGFGDASALNITWIADGLDQTSASEFATGLKSLAGGKANVDALMPDAANLPAAFAPPAQERGSLGVTAFRPSTASPATIEAQALAANGRELARTTLNFGASSLQARGTIELPLELLNSVEKLGLVGQQSAAATYLLDDRFRRKTVALRAGTSFEEAQPLLSPTYYVSRALEPFAEISEPQTPEQLKAAIDAGVSMLVLADVGVIPDAEKAEIAPWIERGGVLVRFAGARLAAAQDDLLPVTLREGGRELGSAMSWETPQSLQPFPEGTPFAGMTPDPSVQVSRQILAEPDSELPGRIWASLTDGTPLVTAKKQGKGLIVMFHATANLDWSNLPASGQFVEMLRRIVDLAPSAGSANAANAAQAVSTVGSFAPRLVLDANGDLTQPSADVSPLPPSAFQNARATPASPAGIYARGAAERAINLLPDQASLTAIAELPAGVAVRDFKPKPRQPLAPYLFAAALALLLGDTLIALLMSGGLNRLRGSTAVIAILVLFAMPHDVHAQAADDPAFKAATALRLAYVETGDSAVDQTSGEGLKGLTFILGDRTSVKAEEPMAVNIERDDIVFFPLLYWPVLADAQSPSDEAIAKMDAYMKNGGTIFFDLREDNEGLGAQSATSEALQRILAKLNIPPLGPVPDDHVLTKSFYLLKDFPGRYPNGRLWVERGDSSTSSNVDGVSSIIIGSNDYAAAWALNDTGDPLYAMVPPDERQREFSFRTGVNIVMYALTGNYKADQVHVPALLERLGQ
jgi:Domain of unknown function (DUF4159)/Aerotolerance regulator N-terminal